MPTFQDEAVAETFEDVKLLVYKTCQEFRRRYGGDIQDIISDASIPYMKAYHWYKRERGKFSNYVRFIVWKQLVQTIEDKVRESQCIPKEPATDIYRCPEKENHRNEKLMDRLGRDGKEVVQLALAPPPELFEVKEPEQKNAIRHYLFDKGWSVERVLEAFRDIEVALKC